jgi:hypothetical protein
LTNKRQTSGITDGIFFPVLFFSVACSQVINFRQSKTAISRDDAFKSLVDLWEVIMSQCMAKYFAVFRFSSYNEQMKNGER